MFTTISNVLADIEIIDVNKLHKYILLRDLDYGDISLPRAVSNNFQQVMKDLENTLAIDLSGYKIVFEGSDHNWTYIDYASKQNGIEFQSFRFAGRSEREVLTALQDHN